MTRRFKVLSVALAFLALLVASGAFLIAHNGACPVSPPPVASATSMRAVVARCYGAPRVARLERLEKPRLAKDRILVKVISASVNPIDWHYLRGEPYLLRTTAGIGTPDDIRMGVDFAGVVEAIGANVRRFKVGDRVFGAADGTFAEYVTVLDGGSIVPLLPNVSFEQAAAVPVAGVTALQALRDRGNLSAGDRVLINGASGGVGTFAVQIAKLLGAKVTGVCSQRNAALVRALGADRVIDYAREDFTRLADRYDLIIDNVGNHSLAEYRRVLAAHGVVVAVGGFHCGFCIRPIVTWLGERAASIFTTQRRLFFLSQMNVGDLLLLRDWLSQRKIQSAIDRTYTLAEVPEALGYLEGGHARAKVIISINGAGGAGGKEPSFAPPRFREL